MLKYIKHKKKIHFIYIRNEDETNMLEHTEIMNSIVREFELSGSTLEHMKDEVNALTKARTDICKLLKMPKFNIEILDKNEKEFISNINIYKLNIEDYEKRQIELKDKLKAYKQEIRVIKLDINKLEDRLQKEKSYNRKLREALNIFLSREKLKFLKKMLVKRYRKVFLKYSSDISIKTEIVVCIKRKEKIQEEKQNFCNTLESFNKKIISNKIALSEKKKGILNMQRRIDSLEVRLQSLKNHKEMESRFGLQVHKCKELNEQEEFKLI